MDWLSRLEKKYGRYAIPNLMKYVVCLYAAGFAILYLAPGFYETYLSLNPQAILNGQVWRIFTFLMDPPSTSLLFIFFALILYYYIGQALEMAWGTFRFNVYFLSGVLFHVLAAILVYLLTGVSLQMDTNYLNLSLFLVFAALFPDIKFMLYFFIPVKVKWLAILDLVFFGYTIVQAFLPQYGGSQFGIYYKANALAAAVSILNFVIFYASTKKTKQQMKRRKADFERKIQTAQRQKQMTYNEQTSGARHKCAVCGKTEKDDPNLEFRYCSKCNGNYEYCREHLFTHQHVE